MFFERLDRMFGFIGSVDVWRVQLDVEIVIFLFDGSDDRRREFVVEYMKVGIETFGRE